MKTYDYIFWDLDGTIVNSLEGVGKSVQYALEAFGILLEDAQLRRFIGPPLRHSFPAYCGLNEEQTEAAIRRYRERYVPVGVYECELYPGVAKTLSAFRRKGRVQALTSSKPEEMCKRILQKFGIEGLFDEIVGASLDGTIDTKEQVLAEAFQRMQKRDPGFRRESVALIGDTHFDAEGAAKMGIDCIGVSYGFGTQKELFEHGAVAVYPDLDTLCADMCREESLRPRDFV